MSSVKICARRTKTDFKNRGEGVRREVTVVTRVTGQKEEKKEKEKEKKEEKKREKENCCGREVWRN